MSDNDTMSSETPGEGQQLWTQPRGPMGPIFMLMEGGNRQRFATAAYLNALESDKKRLREALAEDHYHYDTQTQSYVRKQPGCMICELLDATAQEQRVLLAEVAKVKSSD